VIVDQDMRARLVDWGLAVFYHTGERYSHRVGTKPYKSPELLVEWQQQDHSLDIWGLGMVLGCLVLSSVIQAKAHRHGK
jgi:casein kinase II subunit alpha